MFWRRRRANDFNAEIDEHLQIEAERFREEGLSDAEALLAARRSFGNVTAAQERFYESRRFRLWDVLWQDLRFGARMLGKNRGSTIVAILTLAFGIGANTAIFSLLNALLLRNLPVRAPHELVLFGSGRGRGSTMFFMNAQLFSYPFYRDFRKANQVFSNVTAISSILLGLHGRVGGSTSLEPIKTELVSGTFFQTLGVNAALGRLFTEEEDRTPGGHPVAVASHAWWQRRFARATGAVGTRVAIGSTVYTIIGVAPPEFFGVNVGVAPELWIPLSMEKEISPAWNGLDNPRFNSLHILARLKPGVSMAEASAQTDTVFRQLVRGYMEPQPPAQTLERLRRAHIELTSASAGLSDMRQEFSTPLKILMAVVALVLLIACANVANLLLARASTRQREIATRISLGAGRWRLIRQLSIESGLLGLAGAGLGVLLASQGTQLLVRMAAPSSKPASLSVAPDGMVLAFTLGIAILTVILFGTAPAFYATRLDLVPSLKDGRGSSAAPIRSRLARGLVAGQVAFSLALLVVSGLFLRSLVKLTNIDTGFDKDDVVLTGIDPSAAGYQSDSRLQSMMQRVEERVASIPGVAAASFAFYVFDGGSWSVDVTVTGRQDSPEDPNVVHNIVGAGYLDAMNMPVLSGRGLVPSDNQAGKRVAVVNETMARTFFPGVSPLGRTFSIEEVEWGSKQDWRNIEVVGVVKNAKYETLQEQPRPAAFYPHAQHTGPFLYGFVARHRAGFASAVPQIRKAIAEVDPNLPVEEFASLSQIVRDSVLRQRLVAELSAFFGILAAFLACIGLYGVMSHAVARRTNEFGIRMAIGAERGDVLRMVLGEAARLVVAGVVAGFALALAGGRLIASFLFGVSSYDPMSLTLAATLLLAVALFAAFLPARRATRIDPMTALRYE